MSKHKYNVIDEHGRLIDESVGLKRAKATTRENRGSKLVKAEVKK